MLTASDIQKKEFDKGLIGYRETEVDAFLEEITSDYDMMTRENSELKNRINMLNDKINYYSSIEDTLQKTLVVAQMTAEEVIVSARKNSDTMMDDAQKKSQNLISDSESKSFKMIEDAEEKANKIIEAAELKTEKIVDSARNQVIESKEEYEQLRKEIQLFKTKYKAMLTSQLESVEYYSEKGNVFDLNDVLKDEKEKSLHTYKE